MTTAISPSPGNPPSRLDCPPTLVRVKTHRRKLLHRLIAVVTLALLPLGSAQATWSIIGVDPDTREVGVAGASCSGMVWPIARLVPGKGVVVAQAHTSLQGRNDAATMLEEGRSPEDIIAFLSDSSYDEDSHLRQYAVASLSDSAAVFSGDSMEPWSGSILDEHVSIQGNSLVSEAVITDAYAAFYSALDRGAPLEEQLLEALEAGSAAGGDNRCPENKTAKSAFLFVADPDDGRRSPRIEIKARDPRGDGNPVDEVRERYDRQDFGCQLAPSPSGGGILVLGMFLFCCRKKKMTPVAVR